MVKGWQSWMALLFSLACVSFYLQTSRSRTLLISELSLRLQELNQEQRLALTERDYLMQRLRSESDPAWIEMILMKDLGVVPEGWVKVRFIQ
jgi:hypothetical protein